MFLSFLRKHTLLLIKHGKEMYTLNVRRCSMCKICENYSLSAKSISFAVHIIRVVLAAKLIFSKTIVIRRKCSFRPLLLEVNAHLMFLHIRACLSIFSL